MILNIKKLTPEAVLPSKAHTTDAAFDITTNESYAFQPGERHTFTTGFAAEFPSEYVALLRDRSSLGSKGIQVLAGVIDASYRGEWKVVLLNTSTEPYEIKAGERIAQCLMVPVPAFEVVEVDELGESDRGTGGFGSSGK